MKRLGCWMLLFILVIGGITACSQPSGGGITVQTSWARPAQAGNNTAVYFVIDNSEGRADTLLSAVCEAAEACELHLSTMDASGVMKMTHQDNVPIPEKEKVSFKPGGLHVIVMKLKNDLKTGDRFTLTLNFEKAGAVKVEAPVREQ